MVALEKYNNPKLSMRSLRRGVWRKRGPRTELWYLPMFKYWEMRRKWPGRWEENQRRMSQKSSADRLSVRRDQLHQTLLMGRLKRG